MINPFTIHWDQIETETVPVNTALFALWPAPVNPDLCFQEAGFTDFDDGDDAWEAMASAMLTALFKELEAYGAARRLSRPAEALLPWHLRLIGAQPQTWPLREEVEMTLSDDRLPDCIVAFGESGITMRTGSGHHLFWLRFPAQFANDFPIILDRVNGGHPVFRTRLQWKHLKRELGD